MTIQILGGGCPNCHELEQNAREAARRLGIEINIEKVTDSDEILEMGVLRTPGYAIEGFVQKFGKVFPTEVIEESIKAFTGS